MTALVFKTAVDQFYTFFDCCPLFIIPNACCLHFWSLLSFLLFHYCLTSITPEFKYKHIKNMAFYRLRVLHSETRHVSGT